ncbi:acyltransferase [Agromyces atrinae]|uniref:acyltransferase family protein n=1 Tax=Agromyces atrinae TaxID=592376 RepID=UPI001F564F9C|nr:acyltransferase family protein [Agromyces atrinae]MCI2956150.1 acyltransferase [Agromyces atrinae]
MPSAIGNERDLRKADVAPQGGKKRAFRPDIQGLRMVAVVAVIFDHLIHWPSGGFVGVDVFFVISGFLITSLLLREHEKTGSISFIDFYRRRIKRILPAATLVIVATVTAAFFLFNRFRFDQTFWDGVWGTFFAANWRFASAGTDYFQQDGPVSPLQHYWSLSVEEQFYFVWPWLMLLIFVLMGKKRSGSQAQARRWILSVISVISVASFAWSMYETATNPTWAYFSTFSRAWELGVGAIIAVLAGVFARIPPAVRPLLGWVGLAGIIASLFVIDGTIPFPAPWAALPVLATALVIIAGTGGEQRFVWPIMNPVATYLGDISYSLYLWHFPLIVLLAPFFPPGDLAYYLVTATAILVLSAASYHLVENPIRKSTWLEAKPSQRRRSRRRQRPGHSALPVVALASVALVATVLVVLALAPRAPGATATARPPAASIEPTDPVVSAEGAAADLAAEISVAASATEWPVFNPSLDNLADQRVPQWTDNGCLDVDSNNEELCVYGSGAPTKTAVVLGDSIATSWLPAVIGALEPRGYQVRALTKQGCPVAQAAVYPSGQSTEVYAACADHQAWATDRVAEIQPDLIILSDSFLSIRRLVSEAEGGAAQAEWEGAFGAAIDALPAGTSKVALMAPPGSENLQECYTPISKPSDCVRPIMEDWFILRDAESAVAAEKGVTFIDTRDWFCLGDRCPSFVGTAAVYADSGHLTGTYSARLAPVLEQALATAALDSIE